MDNKKYILYCHTLKKDGRKYFGITSRLPNKRWKNGRGYSYNQYFKRAIDKYGWDSFKHEILLTDLTEEEAKNKEIEYIAKYNTQDYKKGFNQSAGGDGLLNPNEESRKRMSESHLGQKGFWDGKHRDEETRRKLSEANIGHKHTQEQKEKVSKKLKGRERHKSEIEALYKAVYQMDKEYNIIKKWEGIKLAQNVLGLDNSAISAVCRGKRNFVGGYRWCYVDDYVNLDRKIRNLDRKLICLELGTVFSNRKEASIKTNTKSEYISYSLKSGNRGGDYHWEYFDEDIDYTKNKYYKNNTNPKIKGIKCVETKKVFHTLKEAGLYYGVTDSAIYNAIKKGGKSCGYHWEYVR